MRISALAICGLVFISGLASHFMSRVGKLPIILPNGTQAAVENNFIIIKGPKGELKQQIHNLVKVEADEKEVKVTVRDQKDKKQKALWGLFRNLIKNMVIGVNEGFEKKLELVGVGYRASASGNKIILNVGYSHQVDFNLPAGVLAKVEGNVITLNGIDKQLIGETAARLRKIRKPEPYKGKGIKYFGEIIKRKAGKAAAKGAK